MHLQYVVLCDQVIVANDGKPSLIGILNDLQTSAVPVSVPRLAFAARILFTTDETAMAARGPYSAAERETLERLARAAEVAWRNAQQVASNDRARDLALVMALWWNIRQKVRNDLFI